MKKGKRLTSVNDEYEVRDRLSALMEPKPWVGLTDDEVYRIAFELEGHHWRKVADAIEAKLKEKNT